jgi:hypothetical protein
MRMLANRVSCHSMLDDINPADFAHHVRHAKNWNDLGIRCGLKPDKFGSTHHHGKESMLQQKVNNMRLDVTHFFNQQSLISDDDFKTIVAQSDNVYKVVSKCGKWPNGREKAIILKRIADLDIDIRHLKIRTRSTPYPRHRNNKVDVIDDETFKTLVKNNTTWKNLALACGFKRHATQNKLAQRIEMLGLDTNHFDCCIQLDNDKIFVVESDAHPQIIKKRLVRDFDRAYECAACKNQAFIKSDGVLLWNNKEIVLQLEHKNGINNDNRLDNLEFLCPSCHSQTSTFCGGNGKKRRAMLAWLEEGKTSYAPGSIASLLN